jgi:fosfomycin resistance protein FosX
MKIHCISHITFICQDIAKTAHMLKEIFDAKEIYHSGDKTFSLSREKFFNIAGTWIAIMEGAAVEKTYNHVAFKVDEKDLPQFKIKIEALNLTILPGRKREAAEGESLYFYDYDKHLFELHTGDLTKRLKFYNQ